MQKDAYNLMSSDGLNIYIPKTLPVVGDEVTILMEGIWKFKNPGVRGVKLL